MEYSYPGSGMPDAEAMFYRLFVADDLGVFVYRAASQSYDGIMHALTFARDREGAQRWKILGRSGAALYWSRNEEG